MTKIFDNPVDFRKSLEMRLLKSSQASGQDLQRLRKQVAFERFLARLFNDFSSPWILKGGHAMELRLEMARATQDIDLFVKTHSMIADQQLILEYLQKDSSRNLSDFFEYRVSMPQLELTGPPYGGFRFPIEARIATRSFEKFHLDIGIGDICIEPIEKIKGKGWLDFCGVPTPTYLVISIEQQFAEKVHAYTLSRGDSYNSRVKDLVDMLLLIQLNQMNQDKLLSALKKTFARRRTHELPETLPQPPQEWKTAFQTLAAQCGLKNIEESFRIVTNFYEEVLLIKK
jgi:predicted nucleotidyltransferase component of viral defense system